MNWISDLFSAVIRPFQWWVVVAPWERALRIRWGKRVAVLGPGIHLKVPFIDRIYRQSIRLTTIRESGISAMTADGKCATVTISLHFLVRDILALYDSLASPEATLMAIASEQVVKELSMLHSSKVFGGDLGIGVDIPRSWGLGEVRAAATSFAIGRAFRLLNNGYQETHGMNTNMHEDDAH